MYEARQAVDEAKKLEEEMGTCRLPRLIGSPFRDESRNRIAKSERKFERRSPAKWSELSPRVDLEMTGVDLETMEEVWQQVKRQEIDLKGITRSVCYLCHFLNDKRLICVKNIYPKGAIFDLLISTARWRRGGIMKVCGTGHVGILLSRLGYSIVFST